MEEYSYTSTHPLGHTGPLKGSLYPYFYLFYNLLLSKSIVASKDPSTQISDDMA